MALALHMRCPRMNKPVAIRGKIDLTIFADYHGKYLWSSEINMSKLHGRYEVIIHNGKGYTVRRVAIFNGIQYVNFELPQEINNGRNASVSLGEE
jgi:hypothetical protein